MPAERSSRPRASPRRTPRASRARRNVRRPSGPCLVSAPRPKASARRASTAAGDTPPRGGKGAGAPPRGRGGGVLWGAYNPKRLGGRGGGGGINPRAKAGKGGGAL